MCRFFRKVLTQSLLFALGWSNSQSILAQTAAPLAEESRQEFTVLVYNYAQVSPQVVIEALDRAKSIFGHAGIEMAWLQRVPNQPIPPEKLDRVDYVARILPHARAALGRSALGEALLCGAGQAVCFVNIFLDRVKEQARQGSLGLDQVLGHAIAHELGHLLLGSNSHFSIGLMKAKWQKEELQRIAKGDLLFRPEQTRLMQANLLSRFNREGRDTLGSVSSTR